jgi:hypothetical protein
MKTHEYVILEISLERDRQISVEGWTSDHDDDHSAGELAVAASCYANPAPFGVRPAAVAPPLGWPWEASRWKPKDSRSNLVRAAALLVAEIERLDRLSKR